MHDRVHVASVADVNQTDYPSMEISSLAVNGKFGTFVNNCLIIYSIVIPSLLLNLLFLEGILSFMWMLYWWWVP